MFKINKADLAKKTDSQFAALFQDASKALGTEATRNSAQTLLFMIRAEPARRDPR
jgi:hypothetical protein